MSRIRLGQMLIIDALQNALAARLGVAEPADSMFRTVGQYTYRRPRGASRSPRKADAAAVQEPPPAAPEEGLR